MTTLLPAGSMEGLATAIRYAYENNRKKTNGVS